MCDCQRHHDADAQCTCLCPEHADIETRRFDPTDAMRALVAAHDDLVDQLGGDAYVSVTASWRPSDDAPFTTLSYSTVDPDDEDRDDV